MVPRQSLRDPSRASQGEGPVILPYKVQQRLSSACPAIFLSIRSAAVCASEKTDQSRWSVKREAAAANVHSKSKRPGRTLQTHMSKELKQVSCAEKWRRSSHIGPITGFEIKALTVCQHMLRLCGRRGFGVRLPPSTPPIKGSIWHEHNTR